MNPKIYTLIIQRRQLEIGKWINGLNNREIFWIDCVPAAHRSPNETIPYVCDFVNVSKCTVSAN